MNRDDMPTPQFGPTAEAGPEPAPDEVANESSLEQAPPDGVDTVASTDEGTTS